MNDQPTTTEATAYPVDLLSFAQRLSKAIAIGKRTDEQSFAQRLSMAVAIGYRTDEPSFAQRLSKAIAIGKRTDEQSFAQRLSKAIAIGKRTDEQSLIVSNPIKPYSNPTVNPSYPIPSLPTGAKEKTRPTDACASREPGS